MTVGIGCESALADGRVLDAVLVGIQRFVAVGCVVAAARVKKSALSPRAVLLLPFMLDASVW